MRRPARRLIRAKLDVLTPRQRQALEQWLDHERLSYSQAVLRLREQFGISVSTSSLARWVRKQQRLPDLHQLADRVSKDYPIGKPLAARSRLDKLPEAQRRALHSWLFADGLTYNQAAARLKAEFGILASPTAIARFFDRVTSSAAVRIGRDAAIREAGAIWEAAKLNDQLHTL